MTEVWVGSYSVEQNAYDIDTLEAFCKIESRKYMEGSKGVFTPIAFGETYDEVRDKLDTMRESRQKALKDFETKLIDNIRKTLGEGCQIEIENDDPNVNFGVGDASAKDFLMAVPEDYGDFLAPMIPIIELFNVYETEYKATDGDDFDSMKAFADKVVATFQELWEDPPVCSECQ